MAIITKIIYIVLLCLATSIPIVNAQTIPTEANIEIIATYAFVVPAELNLPDVFVDNQVDKTVYQDYPVNDPAYQIKFYDLREAGGFNVFVNMKNLTSGGSQISYKNISIATITAGADTVDTAAFNAPAGTDGGTVMAPLNCNWDFVSPLGSSCNTAFNAGNFTGNNPTTSDPITIISADCPMNCPTAGGRRGAFWVTPILKILIPAGTMAGHYGSTADDITFSLSII